MSVWGLLEQKHPTVRTRKCLWTVNLLFTQWYLNVCVCLHQSEPAVSPACCRLRSSSEGFDRLQQQTGFSARRTGTAETAHRTGLCQRCLFLGEQEDTELVYQTVWYNWLMIIDYWCFSLQDVSCNEIQTLPPQVGQLEVLRDLNIRRNHMVRLPPGKAVTVSYHLKLSYRWTIKGHGHAPVLCAASRL